MKPLFFVVSIFFVFASQANAQLLNQGDQWVYDIRHHFGGGNYFEEIHTMKVVSDTVINGLAYYKIEASGLSPCGVFRGTEYLRESEDRVYRLAQDMSGEDMMIDFTEQDAYDMTYEINSYKINTMVINGAKKMEVFPSDQEIELQYQRIENNMSFDNEVLYKLSREIGYVHHGFLFPNIGTGLCDSKYSLHHRCKISGSDTLRLTSYDCFESSKSQALTHVEPENTVVYPNPTAGKVYIAEAYKCVGIMDVAGRTVKVDNSSRYVDLSLLPRGVYHIQLKNRKTGAIVSSRIVKR